MHEFKEGDLHSGKTETIVTNPKQAIAIALSEAEGLDKKTKKWFKTILQNWKLSENLHNVKSNCHFENNISTRVIKNAIKNDY